MKIEDTIESAKNLGERLNAHIAGEDDSAVLDLLHICWGLYERLDKLEKQQMMLNNRIQRVKFETGKLG